MPRPRFKTNPYRLRNQSANHTAIGESERSEAEMFHFELFFKPDKSARTAIKPNYTSEFWDIPFASRKETYSVNR